MTGLAQDWFEWFRTHTNVTLFQLGEAQFTIWSIFYAVALLVLLFVITEKIRGWIVDRLLARRQIDVGIREAVGSIVRYLVIVIGLLVILQTIGVDLTTLNILAGALGIGIGFGLQNIVGNFVSGLIILFERPIKVGDRIVVGDVEGRVIKINARSTTVVTNDNIAIIVPNSEFIEHSVVNWSYTDAKVRFRIPVGVAYGSDVRLVERLLLEVAHENPNVLDDPRPAVRFLEFGDSALHFELRAWSTKLMHKKGMLTSELNFAINEKFQEHNVEIPFPQRDLHIRSNTIAVKSNQQVM